MNDCSQRRREQAAEKREAWLNSVLMQSFPRSRSPEFNWEVVKPQGIVIFWSALLHNLFHRITVHSFLYKAKPPLSPRQLSREELSSLGGRNVERGARAGFCAGSQSSMRQVLFGLGVFYPLCSGASWPGSSRV